MDDLGNSRRNRTDLTLAGENGENLTNDIVVQYEHMREKKGDRAFSREERATFHRHVEMVIADLLSAWEGDTTKFIGYNRGNPYFTRKGCYWNHRLNMAFPSQRHFLNAIGFLAEADFITNINAQPGAPGFSSRMRATEKLAQAFLQHEVNWASISIDPDADVIFVKDDNKKVIPPGEAAGYEAFDLQAADANLRRINANLQSTYINLNVTDAELAAIEARLSGDDEDDEFSRPLEFSDRSLRRIFSLSSFNCGGRFYGGWWQGVPSAYRKFILIDGAVTREMDFSSMHPRLMYADLGHEPPEDAYILPDWPLEIRKHAKKAFNQLVNSDETSRNPNQWHRFAPDIEPDPLPEGWKLMSKQERRKAQSEEFGRRFKRPYSDLLQDLLERHKPINDHFFSKAWGRLQRLDSDIAERVMIKLLDAEVPITALPIHDSFIVRRGAEGELENAMNEVHEEVTGTLTKIKWDESVYDAPEGHKPGIAFWEDHTDATIKWTKESTKYHKRESEWLRVNGTVD